MLKNILKHNNNLIVFIILIFAIVLRILKAFYFRKLSLMESTFYLESLALPSVDVIFGKTNFFTNMYSTPFLFRAIYALAIKIDKFYYLEIIKTAVCGISIVSFIYYYKILIRIFCRNNFVIFSSLIFYALSNFFINYGIEFRDYAFSFLFVFIFCYEYIVIVQSLPIDEVNILRSKVKIFLLSFIALSISYSSVWPIFSFLFFSLLVQKYRRYIFPPMLISFLLWSILTLIQSNSFLLAYKVKETHLSNSPILNFRNYDFLSFLSNYFKLQVKFYDVGYSYEYLVALLFILSLISIPFLYKRNKYLALFIFIAGPGTNLCLLLLNYTIDFKIISFKNLWFSNLVILLSFFYLINCLKNRVVLILISITLLVCMFILNYNHLPTYHADKVTLNVNQLSSLFNFYNKNFLPEQNIIIYQDNGNDIDTLVAYIYMKSKISPVMISENAANDLILEDESSFLVKKEGVLPEDGMLNLSSLPLENKKSITFLSLSGEPADSYFNEKIKLLNCKLTIKNKTGEIAGCIIK